MSDIMFRSWSDKTPISNQTDRIKNESFFWNKKVTTYFLTAIFMFWENCGKTAFASKIRRPGIRWQFGDAQQTELDASKSNNFSDLESLKTKASVSKIFILHFETLLLNL